jgi:uncharacterized protein (UPF0210 family)
VNAAAAADFQIAERTRSRPVIRERQLRVRDLSMDDRPLVPGAAGGSWFCIGTMTAALAVTTAVKAVKVNQVGYSGLMLPVMEDKRLAQRWAENTYEIDSLLAYSSVCGTGLDTVPLPGDVSEERLVKIFSDVAALAWKWHKPLTARLQPVTNKRAGEKTDFDSQYLFNTTLHPAR